MSKSYGNTIGLFEEEKALRKKIMGIVTDSDAGGSAERPRRAPRFSRSTGCLLRPRKSRAMEEEFRAGGVGYGDFKKRLFGAIWEFLGPFRERRQELERDAGSVDAILTAGGQKAGRIARQTMQRVRTAVGLR